MLEHMTAETLDERAERIVVRWLQSHGFPCAERRARRGTKDAGDITGTPGICWEVKDVAQTRRVSDNQIGTWLAKLERARQHADAAWAVLVTRRHGTGNVGLWWAWMPLDSTILLGSGPAAPRRRLANLGWPVRMHLAAAAELLRAAGYGEPL